MTQDILKDCTVEGLVVKLPAGQLERNVYLEIKKKLELIGGKWKGGKTQGFVFEEDPSELLEAVANGDDRNLKKEYQFFATPPELALRMAEELTNKISGTDRVLEPSAGDGALIKAIHKQHFECSVDCFEAMELNRMKLQKVPNIKIIGNDFLLCTDHKDWYDYIIANPPFTKNQDILHICKMYECLRPCGSIVTLSSKSWMIGSQKMQRDFHLWLTELGADIREIEPGQFKDSGTMVGSLMITIAKPKDNKIKIPESVQKKLDSYIPSAETLEEFVDQFPNPCTPKNFQEQANEFVKNRKSETVKKVRTCRVCGCTDDNCIQCIEKTGSPCHWVEEDLCSACQEITNAELEVSAYHEPAEIIKELIATNKEIEKGTLELQKMISPENNNGMNFFQQLFEQLDGIDLTLNVKRKNGKITLSVLPQTAGTISPALITGTPDELDEGFFEAIKVPIQEAKGLKVDLANLETSIKTAKEKKEADLKEAVKKASEKPAEKSNAKGNKKDAKSSAKKPEAKEKPVKDETPKSSVPDLFANV